MHADFAVCFHHQDRRKPEPVCDVFNRGFHAPTANAVRQVNHQRKGTDVPDVFLKLLVQFGAAQSGSNQVCRTLSCEALACRCTAGIQNGNAVGDGTAGCGGTGSL